MRRPLLVFIGALVCGVVAVAPAAGVPEQTPKRGGTLDLLTGREPACLSLILTQCQGFNSILNGVIEGAFKQAPDFSWRERLVSRVDYTSKPPFTLTYHIRPEARWSDGVPVSARDFVFTYETRLKYPALPEDDPYRTMIRSVRIVDGKTVKVALRSRYAFWRVLFDHVFPEHVLRGEDLEKVWLVRIDNPKTGRAIGNGPFLVGDWERGEYLELVRNPRYSGLRKAYLNRIVVRWSLDHAQIAARFRDGSADVAQYQYADDWVSALESVPGVELRFRPDSPGWEHLDFRLGPGGHPALRNDGRNNKLVRRAIAYGIDRVAIARSYIPDLGARVRPLDSALLRSGSRGYKPNWSAYRYRPTETHRLLRQAGCRRGGDGIYSCAGERLTLRFVGRSAGRLKTLELLRAQLLKVGIDVRPAAATQFAHDQILETGDFDATLFAWFAPAADEAGGPEGLYGCGGDQNYMGYCQRLVTADLDQADRILDADRRARVLNRADRQLALDVPTLPLYEIWSVAIYRPGVRNFANGSGFNDPTWNAENWWLDD